MAEVIPFSGGGANEQGVRRRLDGITYRFGRRWNTQGEYWALSLSKDDGTPLFAGLRGTLGVNILRQFVGDAYPPGSLVLVDTSGQSLPPDRTAFASGRVQLIYTSAEELNNAS